MGRARRTHLSRRQPTYQALPFWEWLIREVKQADYPDTIFLAEAFTRPKVMYHLAKLGFTQSYTYFAWRNSKEEIIEYFTTLTHTEVREYFRPNLWPNTPDILTEYLQFGGRPAFMARLVLAATLGASYGIYGPAFELCENRPREPGQRRVSQLGKISSWQLGPRQTRQPQRLYRARQPHPAWEPRPAQRPGFALSPVTNDQLLCYSKPARIGNIIIVVVNLDPIILSRAG